MNRHRRGPHFQSHSNRASSSARDPDHSDSPAENTRSRTVRLARRDDGNAGRYDRTRNETVIDTPWDWVRPHAIGTLEENWSTAGSRSSSRRSTRALPVDPNDTRQRYDGWIFHFDNTNGEDELVSAAQTLSMNASFDTSIMEGEINESGEFDNITKNTLEQNKAPKEFAHFKRKGFEMSLIRLNGQLLNKNLGWRTLTDYVCQLCKDLAFDPLYCKVCFGFFCPTCRDQEAANGWRCPQRPITVGHDRANRQINKGTKEHIFVPLEVSARRFFNDCVEVACMFCGPLEEVQHADGKVEHKKLPKWFDWYAGNRHHSEGCPEALCASCGLYATSPEDVHLNPVDCKETAKEFAYWTLANARALKEQLIKLKMDSREEVRKLKQDVTMLENELKKQRNYQLAEQKSFRSE